jgi:hypothetical protein
MPQFIPAIIGAVGSISGSVYSSSSAKTQQHKLLAHQEAMVKQAEDKAAAAEELAGQKASETLKKKRLSQTQTIFTTPLGIAADTGSGSKPTLLGSVT